MSGFPKILLDYLLKHTNKKIHLFTENSHWRGENIMKDSKLRYAKPIMWNGKYPFGKLGYYIGYGGESPEILDLVKFIRKNRDRITIYGADPDIIDRDEAMSKTILANLLPEGINIWFAANHHVDTDKYEEMSQKLVPNPEKIRYFAGYYLRKALGKQYCIVLSQAYQGTVRYNGICIGDDCYDRIANLDYIYRDFTITEFRKYVVDKKKIQLLDRKDFVVDEMPFFNATYHCGIKRLKCIGDSGGLYGKNTKKWNYMLFWNKVGKLDGL